MTPTLYLCRTSTSDHDQASSRQQPPLLCLRAKHRRPRHRPTVRCRPATTTKGTTITPCRGIRTLRRLTRHQRKRSKPLLQRSMARKSICVTNASSRRRPTRRLPRHLNRRPSHCLRHDNSRYSSISADHLRQAVNLVPFACHGTTRLGQANLRRDHPSHT